MGDGSDGANLGVFVEPLQDFSSHFAPRYEFGEVLLDFFEGFVSEGLDGFGGFSGGMGTICDCCVELVDEPVDGDVDGAAVGPVDLQSGSKWVELGQLSRVHQTSLGNIAVVLTLCFCED